MNETQKGSTQSTALSGMPSHMNAQRFSRLSGKIPGHPGGPKEPGCPGLPGGPRGPSSPGKPFSPGAPVRPKERRAKI